MVAVHGLGRSAYHSSWPRAEMQEADLLSRADTSDSFRARFQAYVSSNPDARMDARNYLSAAKTLYLLWDLPSVVEVFSSYAWSLTLKAIMLSVRPPIDNRSAATYPHLEALVLACSRDASLWPLKVALVFGYLGYLRVSNLAPESLKDFDSLRHTTWQDMWPSKQGILLAIKWTKTGQAAVYRAPVPLPALGNSPVSLVSVWRDYVDQLVHVPRTPHSPILLSTTAPPGRVITIPILRTLLRPAAHIAGLSHCHYTPHSLRRGGPHTAS